MLRQLLIAVAFVAALVLVTFLVGRPESEPEGDAGAVLIGTTGGSTGQSELSDESDPEAGLPDLSGEWRLEGDGSDMVVHSNESAEPGQPENATIRFRPDSKLGEALRGTRFAFEVSGDSLSYVRLVGSVRNLEGVFQITAHDGKSIQMLDASSKARAMLTLAGQDVVDFQIQARKGGITQRFLRVDEGT